MSKRFRVRLANERGISSVGPDAVLDEEPAEGDEIVLEDGTPAFVRYVLTAEDGETVIAAQRLPRD